MVMMTLITKLEVYEKFLIKKNARLFSRDTLLGRVCSIGLQSPLRTVVAENAYRESTTKSEIGIQAHILNQSP